MADGGIPIGCLPASASPRDSQAAIPLATMTAAPTRSLYDLMDSAYDGPEIRDHSRSLGHVPIIGFNPRSKPGLKQELAAEARRRKRAGYRLAEDVRYNERSTVERVGCQPFGTGRNGRLEDDFGGEFVRARGLDKIMCHLMFGVLAPAVEQSMRQLMQAPIRLPRR